MIRGKQMQIVIDNYFKSECDVNTSIRQAFEKGFRIGVKKVSSIESERKAGKWRVLKDRSSGQEFSCCNRCDHYYSANTSDWNFCPNCGLPMKKGENND